MTEAEITVMCFDMEEENIVRNISGCYGLERQGDEFCPRAFRRDQPCENPDVNHVKLLVSWPLPL